MNRKIFGVRIGVLALIASLAVNAFFIAEGVGRSLGRDGPPGRGAAALLRDAPDDVRERVRAIRTANADRVADARRAAYAAGLAVADALEAEPFDQAALAAAFAAARSAGSELRSIGDEATLALASSAPAEFRQRMAERVRARAERRLRRAERRARWRDRE